MSSLESSKSDAVSRMEEAEAKEAKAEAKAREAVRKEEETRAEMAVRAVLSGFPRSCACVCSCVCVGRPSAGSLVFVLAV